METVYPVGPTDCPDDLTQATPAYRRQAWVAMASLLGFVLLYIALAAWFSWSGITMLLYAFQVGLDGLVQWVVGLSAVFLAVFMIKALFFVRKGGEPDHLEVNAEQEPALFDFLHRLADEAGAPRPHRVFLSARVNAAVFYDLSIKNLIFPSRKNLEIGLGLVNILSLSELKAVLAHEFGHFAQRSMAVGNWVYIAQQIAAYIIAQRDILDRFLRQLSFMDVRIAWIGWLLRMIVWSLRAILETVFEWVVLAQRALSREMEFQADLVSVSLSGSDAIVNALYRLQAADDAWDRTLSFVGSEIGAGRETEDVFVIQQRVLERMAEIYNDPDYGRLPKSAETPNAELRLFEAEVAQPPRMWATHPPNHEREQNAKQRYVECVSDPRSAWDVFGNANELRKEFSQRLHNAENLSATSFADSIRSLDQRYQREFLSSEYQGAYLGRSCVRHCGSVEELYEETKQQVAANSFDVLYPNSLADTMDKLRELQREQGLLKALQDGSYDAPGGIIRHRGTELQVNDLPHTIVELQEECLVLEREVQAHDQKCRSMHRAAAESISSDWAGYHTSLLTLLHYADHAEANIRDANGALQNVYRIITADRHVSGRERKRLVKAAQELQTQLSDVYAHSDQLSLNGILTSELEIENWSNALGEWTMPAPTIANIGDWFENSHNWVAHTAGHLGALRAETLEQLLACEAQIRALVTQGGQTVKPPSQPTVPENYAILLPGSERELQKKLGLWDRFQTADGAVAGAIRLLVSVSIVGGALYLTAIVPTTA